MSTRSVTIGCICGVLIGSAGTLAYKSLDAGISTTHQQDVIDTFRHESDVLKALAETRWLGMEASAAKAELEQLGVFDFAKGDEGFAAGPVFLSIEDGHIAEIQHHCSRQKSEWCEKGNT